MPSFVLTSVNGAGVYTGTITGGASNAFAGIPFTITGFTNAANNQTSIATASSATTLTLTNTATVSETHAGTATSAIQGVCLDAGGTPQTVMTAATGTGTGQSTIFAVLDRPTGQPRALWLALGATTGTFSAFKVDLQVSYDGGATWQTQQAAIDLFNSPSQQVSPSPSPGAILRLNVSTFTGGTTASVIASSH